MRRIKLLIIYNFLLHIASFDKYLNFKCLKYFVTADGTLSYSYFLVKADIYIYNLKLLVEGIWEF